jgi:glycosyltransferase involved in cell wall biosynthesis
MPTVSIGLPVYNGEEFIRKAIDSHLEQTFDDLELVICDNASSDSTSDICQKYATEDKRVKYFRNEQNIGASANFRKVFQLSSGQYYKWTCVDDYFASTYLEQCKKVLDDHPEVVVACAKVYIIDGHDKILRTYDDTQELRQYSPSARFRIFLEQDSWVNSVYGLMRASVLRKTSVMGNYPGSDKVVMSEMALHGQFWEIPERLFYRRIHPDAYSYECSLDKQQEFYNPDKTNRLFPLYHWRHLYEHTRSVFRVSLSPLERLRVFAHILRMLSWSRKELVNELGLVIRKAD